MSFTDKEKWDRIYQTKDHTNKQAAQILIENQHLLPESGKALDLACGLGANALLLAKHDLETHAWDISKVAITKLDAKNDELSKATTNAVQLAALEVAKDKIKKAISRQSDSTNYGQC